MDVHFSPELQAKIDRIAAQQGRDAESVVHEAVQRVVDSDDWFLREVEKGLAASDEGAFIDHDEVRKIVTSRYSG